MSEEKQGALREGPDRRWWMVTYPNRVRQVEWMSEAEARTKARATGKPVKQVWVEEDEEADEVTG